ncbi:MAG TPA: Zn-dependent hydrolase [Thermomicrobiaceae bacterium]|nr:Zn-dependent hydrolase [Thermomicrobiaceae bacterium]
MRPAIDGARLVRDLEELARIGATPDGGVNRLAYSPEDLTGRAWVDARLAELGLSVRTDAARNTTAVYPGTVPGLAPIALGSHTDTVPNGGRYDGALGVLAAVACVRALRAAEVRLRHPVELINFMAEEATVGGGTLGSWVMAGLFEPGLLDQPAWDGRPVHEHLRAAGVDPDALASVAREPGSLAAYVELHIEQGGVLAASGESIGAVEGIVGIRRYTAVFDGRANHAGTTPMAERRDALVMAAPFVHAVRDSATAAGIVGTVGAVRVSPGAPNVIPGRVELAVEIRGLEPATLDRVESTLGERAAGLGGRLERPSRAAPKPPVVSDPVVLEAVVAACERLGLPYRRMPSGAGHDAMCMAAITRQGMVFVPSRGGISHAPDEYTAPEQCVDGARVLLETLLELDDRLD